MYVCGVTAYDHAHLGHARAAVAYDVLVRSLLLRGFEVVYARNFTDVDDKIIARAAREASSEAEVAERYERSYRDDVRALNCLDPDLEPKATQFIDRMIGDIDKIIKSGHAYAVPAGQGGGADATAQQPRDVFFDVASLPSYGQLSGRTEADSRPGERVEVDSRKRSPRDFALWKSANPGEPVWPSPWGPGRPGWHIECSAMIRALLGDPIDIHGGGNDLIFPHHENERAQAIACEEAEGGEGEPAGGERGSAGRIEGAGEPKERTEGANEGAAGHLHDPYRDQACCGRDRASTRASHSHPALARFWVHNGFVTVDSEKMSKSLGNFSTVKDVLRRHHPAALRWLLVSTHYRAPLAFSQRALEDAEGKVYDVAAAVAAARDVLGGGDGGAGRARRGEVGERGEAEGEKETGTEVRRGRGAEDDAVGGAAAPNAAADAADAAPRPPPRPFSQSTASQAPPEALLGLADDLGTPVAVAVAFARVKTINDALEGAKKEMDRARKEGRGGSEATGEEATTAAATTATSSRLPHTQPSSSPTSSSDEKPSKKAKGKRGKRHPGASSPPSASKVETLRKALAELEGCAELLGLELSEPEALLVSLRRRALANAGLSEAQVWEALDARAEARKRKDYAEADRARRELEEKGILVMDGVQGTSWRPK